MIIYGVDRIWRFRDLRALGLIRGEAYIWKKRKHSGFFYHQIGWSVRVFMPLVVCCFSFSLTGGLSVHFLSRPCASWVVVAPPNPAPLFQVTWLRLCFFLWYMDLFPMSVLLFNDLVFFIFFTIWSFLLRQRLHFRWPGANLGQVCTISHLIVGSEFRPLLCI